MGSDVSGRRQRIVTRFKGLAAAAALTASLAAGAWLLAPAHTIAASGETRTLSLYQVHTKESLTVTYMTNGRYVPSALKKINYLMRDWRRNEVIKIDPKTIDLMWELHADLGSRAPIHIICGYRSAKTNGFLKRIGRNVARKSQHVQGRAIDMYFPDVKTEKIRNSALVRQVGGVGYYRSSGGPTGFVHIDTGNVRHWGPAISRTQMARIFKEYRKTIGSRSGVKRQAPAPEPASEPSNLVAYDASGEDADEAVLPNAKPQRKLKPADDVAALVPKPREKPIEVLMLAAADLQITPASAPPPRTNFNDKPRPAADNNLGLVEAAETLIEEPVIDEPITNVAAKGSFAEVAALEAPALKPVVASAGETDLFLSSAELIKPSQKNHAEDPVLAAKQAMAASQEIAMASMVPFASGKSDMLLVNRTSKGSFLIEQPVVSKKKQRKTSEDSN